MALTPEQVSAAQSQLGITPTASPDAAGAGAPVVNRAADLEAAWKASEPAPTYGERVASNESAGADVVAKGLQGAASDITGNFSKLQENLKNSPDMLSKALHTLVFAGHTAGDIAGATGSLIGGTAKMAASPLTQIKTPEGDTIGQRFSEPVKANIQKLVDAHPDFFNTLHDLATSHPEAAKSVGDLINTIGLTGGGRLLEAPLPSVKEAVSSIAKDAGGAVEGVGKATKATVMAPVNAAKSATGGIREAAQTAAAKGKIPGIEGVGKQTGTSAERLAKQAVPGGMGAAIRPKPVDSYNEFAKQEGRHLSDIKQDPAISIVGSRIGDAFDTVVKQRQEAGKTMASELEKTATNPVKITDPLDAFSKELESNGATLTRGEKGLDVIPGETSKFSSNDETILKKYVTDLDKLGKSPTMAQLDAFISRVPQDIKGLKATQGINFKTNAERIIGNSLNKMRTALVKSGTKDYKTARSQYADLSKFIKEGASHLGKITQSGDFAKDASLAKSAVQSVLNNGKKDWLMKLEAHTGYPALDEATLALQAMKDAGDYKGNSLLELLTQGAEGAAVGPHGIATKLIGFLGKKTVGNITGSKADQTRAFLKSLEQGIKKAAGGAPKNAQGAAVINSLDDMYTQAPAANAHIDDIAKEIAKETGGTVNPGPVKSKERAQEKINNDYNGDHTRLGDLVRNTIVVSKEKYADAAQMLHNHPDLLGPLKHIKPSDDKMGFGGTIARIKTPQGVTGEIQLNTPEMIYAKESEKSARRALGDKVYEHIAQKTGLPGGQGHKLYEQWRKLNPQSEAASALALKSKTYYTEVVKLWNQKK